MFLAQGYDVATMDEIAALAEVSKPTVYKHFADKRGLFIAVVEGQMSDSEAVTHDMVNALGTTTDLERDLRRFARQHVADVTDPDIVRLRRTVIAHADRFPELAEAWYANGPGRAHAVLAEQLRILTERRLLDASDEILAVQHLNWLILAIPLNTALFRSGETKFSRAELNHYADEAVRIFLAAYATPTHPTS